MESVRDPDSQNLEFGGTKLSSIFLILLHWLESPILFNNH